jgi:hypothetical protein
MHNKQDKKMIRNTLIFLFIFLLPGCARAEQNSFTASVSPGVMRVGDQFNLTYTSDEEISGLALPDVENIQVLGGPSKGHSQSVYSVNGKITTSSTYQYTYFLRALKEGKYTIPGVAVKMRNKTIKCNAVTIEVLAANSNPATGTGQGNTAGNEPVTGKVSEKSLFVLLTLDKKEVYLGERITATVKIYTKVSLSGINPNFKGPDFTGFFTEPVDIPELRNLQSEAYNGDIYYTGVIRKAVIIPQKSGTLTIKPFDMEVAMRQEVRHKISDDPFFQDFDIPEVQDIPVKLKSHEVTVKVKSLPANAPASFGGAVGDFAFNASLNKTETRTNEPVTLKLTVSGNGNVKLINEPPLDLPSDLEKFDPVINTHGDNASQSKTFEYLINPKNPGDFTIPAIEFSYFDPASGQYKSLHSQSFNLHVTRGEGDTMMQVMPGMAKEDIRMINQDIRFIRNKPMDLTTGKSYLADSPLYYLLYLLLLGIFIALIYTRRKFVRERADKAGMRLKKADRYARKRLIGSYQLLRQGETSRFYEELLGAVWGYLSDKLKISMSSLSKETAHEALKAKSVDDSLTDELFQIISESEAARYGMASGSTEMEKLYKDTLRVITSLQQKLK